MNAHVQHSFLVKLEIEFDESKKKLDSLEGQKLWDTKTKGITAYACELMHYGYNISLNFLKDTSREQGTAIFKQFMEHFGGMHDATNPVTTMEKLTFSFKRELYEERFRAGTNPFPLADKNQCQ